MCSSRISTPLRVFRAFSVLRGKLFYPFLEPSPLAGPVLPLMLLPVYLLPRTRPTDVWSCYRV